MINFIKMKNFSLLIASAIAIFFLILGYILGKSSPPPTIFSERRHQGSYKFINPLLECDSSINFSQNVSLSPLKNSLEKTISQLQNYHQLSYASIYFRDLNNGPWLGINEKENFSPASLIKIPLAITYFKAAQNNPELLQESIEATISSNIEKQSILPEVSLSPNQKYTIDELIRRMIIYSDNQAYEILLNHIDNPLLVQTFTDLGIDISAGFSNPSGNIISVKSYAAFFRILFNASYLNQEMSEKLLSLLSQVEYQNALVRGVNNPEITISHKFGERTFEATGEKQLHDCGIVYYPQKPYLICIMTRGQDFSKLSSAIAQLSQVIYQFQSSN